jgi:hypothetical protein
VTDFHPETVASLRNDLNKWREVLDEADSDVRYREEQAAKARTYADGVRSRVADYERLLAVAEFVRCDNCGGELDKNGVCQFNEDGQHPEKDDDGLLPDPLVMDAEEYHASIWTNAIATASTAQLEGVACINCAHVFNGEPNRPVATGPRGQLFAHSHPDDCKGVAL